MKLPINIGRFEWMVYIGAGVAAALFVSLVEYEKRQNTKLAFARYVEVNHHDLDQVAAKLETSFQRIHQGLRTIARLPGVRSIDRYGRSFSADARTSAQEIYNNLAESVAVSEVYILPHDFDPDIVDPNTGKLQEPITTFDHFIVGRTADSTSLAKTGGAGALPTGDVEEIEIHEYRLMKKQIEFLKTRFPHENRILFAQYPAVAGKEVITCDNTRYSPRHPNDNDRLGLVYSVPFFGPKGNMRGMISAVILTAALRDMMPGGANAVSVPAYSLIAGSSENGVWQKFMPSISAILPAERLLYSRIRKLAIPDLRGEWNLWAGQPDKKFWNSAEVISIRDKTLLQEFAITIFLASFAIISRLLAGKHRAVQSHNDELKVHVEQRTIALAKAKSEAETANIAKSHFLASMSHDIRTPLSAITGMADLLQQSPLTPKQTKHLDIIRNAGSNLSHLINQVLDLSVIESGKIVLRPEPTMLRELIGEVGGFFDELAQKKGVELEFDFGELLPEVVLVDADKLLQVLINLIENAIKFGGPGKVVVDIRMGQEPGRIGQDPGPDKQIIAFYVSDSGAGIDPSLRRAIFDPFRQANDEVSQTHGGSGLGLSISKAIVDRMGGVLDFECEVGKRTTFFFSIEVGRLPDGFIADTGPHRQIECNDFHPTEPLRGIDILLVEDNPALCILTREILEPLGCRLSVVGDGRQAIELYEHQNFHLILMDNRLPELDGCDATRFIREQERGQGQGAVPIIALTANAFEHERRRCLDAGMTDYLSKPFTAQQLKSMILSNLAAT